MEFNSFCDNTKLALGLSLNSSPIMVKPNTIGPTKGATETLSDFEPSLTLGLPGNHHPDHPNPNMKVDVAADLGGFNQQDSSVISGGGSSYSNISVKRVRDVRSEESERVSNDNNYSRVMSTTSVDDVEDDDGCVNGRKKLRLTKPQSALLEEAFKLHSSLNPKQKQELAKELKLRPRQVEVWFQNRRARTKLKQSEMDFEHIKKYCEKLTDENRRLQKELKELKAFKSSQQFYMQLPAATLTICPSCERIDDSKSTTVKNPFTMAAKHTSLISSQIHLQPVN